MSGAKSDCTFKSVETYFGGAMSTSDEKCMNDANVEYVDDMCLVPAKMSTKLPGYICVTCSDKDKNNSPEYISRYGDDFTKL